MDTSAYPSTRASLYTWVLPAGELGFPETKLGVLITLRESYQLADVMAVAHACGTHQRLRLVQTLPDSERPPESYWQGREAHRGRVQSECINASAALPCLHKLAHPPLHSCPSETPCLCLTS